jgi:hypothetical protein
MDSSSEVVRSAEQIRERNRLAHKCRDRALRQLRAMHREQYKTLCLAEYVKVGLDIRPSGLTAEQKRQRAIQKLKDRLAALESDN